MAKQTAGSAMVMSFGGWKLLVEAGQGLEHGTVEPIPMGVWDADEGTEGVEGSDVECQ
jgi:hypothetical protein